MHSNGAGHEVVEHRSASFCRPYDRLVLRDTKGRTIWTVLACEPADEGWTVTGDTVPSWVPNPSTRPIRGRAESFRIPRLAISLAFGEPRSIPRRSR